MYVISQKCNDKWKEFIWNNWPGVTPKGKKAIVHIKRSTPPRSFFVVLGSGSTMCHLILHR